MNLIKIIGNYLSHERYIATLKHRQKEEEKKYTQLLGQARDPMNLEEAGLIYNQFAAVNQIEKEILGASSSFEECEDLLEDCLIALKGKSISYQEVKNDQTIHHLFKMVNNEVHHTEKNESSPQ